jgi:hypothetical protein
MLCHQGLVSRSGDSGGHLSQSLAEQKRDDGEARMHDRFGGSAGL